MCDLPVYVLDLVDKIAKSEGFTEFSVDIKPGSNHGDNFLGILSSTVVSGTRVKANGEHVANDTLNLLCKIAPANPARRKEFRSVPMFKRESLMYNEIFPLFAEFQREKGLSVSETFCAYPKCYEAIADEATDQFVIIMEDVRPQGFAMLPKAKGTPLEQELLLMEQLGRLHGISFALKDQRPGIYEGLKSVHDLFMEFFENESMHGVVNGSFDRAIGVVMNEKHKQILEEQKTNYLKLYEQCLLGDVCEPFGVIGHGDCWTNNMLFRYKKGTNEVTDICLVDWQLSRYGSPTLDLLHNIFSSTDWELRQTEYNTLLERYYNSLSSMITRLGSDPQKLFTFANFQREMKRFGTFGSLIGTLMQQFISAEATDIPNLDTYSENLKNENAAIEVVGELGAESMKKYAKRINDIMTDFVNLGYYQ